MEKNQIDFNEALQKAELLGKYIYPVNPLEHTEEELLDLYRFWNYDCSDLELFDIANKCGALCSVYSMV